MMGLATRAIATRGGPRRSAARSGLETAAFLGTISPTTTWSPTTMRRAMAAATPWVTPAGSPSATAAGSRECASAGSATTPSETEQTVMPSWAHASISETFSIAHSTIRADLLPASALGSIELRRAEITANSAPTKNAFPRSSAIVRSATPVTTRPPPTRGRARPCALRCARRARGRSRRRRQPRRRQPRPRRRPRPRRPPPRVVPASP